MKTPTKPKTRESMADLVTQYLHEQIVSGVLAPGDRITELHIAREFQTSQGPVREAIRRLEGMGLLSTERFKRSTVKVITDSEIQEAYAVRAVLEQLAAEECAKSPNLAVEELRDLAEQARRWAAKGDRSRYVRANAAFHRRIVEQSGNKTLLQAWDVLNLELRSGARIKGAPEEDLMRNQEMHWEILDAIEGKLAAKAGRLLRRHVLQFIRKRSS
ncbi:GntR family transcriptional regulator [Granulicella cerasi]|uniref:GntR family transcriptional regulator n=1 Tax=Granulicella cerasi TaxID=741063 RepID=A0ABW1ZDQ5_9BACT|nr:GntR family transcriptional regulator [Granulicella cerasi]